MSESNKAVVRQFLQALGSGDAEALDRLVTDDVAAVCTGSSLLAGTRGKAEVCGAAGMLKQITQSGIDFRVLQLTAEDDRVSCEAEGLSTLVTGQTYNNQYHFLFTLRGGKISGLREYMDSLLVETVLGPIVRSAAQPG
ncbi:MAG: nuclear transport factor 2 family protein [Pseudomonadota bacterium]|nr:nuclear transport factor 2 family protein [Pseudomonadota bacterium]